MAKFKPLTPAERQQLRNDIQFMRDNRIEHPKPFGRGKSRQYFEHIASITDAAVERLIAAEEAAERHWQDLIRSALDGIVHSPKGCRRQWASDETRQRRSEGARAAWRRRREIGGGEQCAKTS